MDVTWVVNDLGELGVKVEGEFHFLYKGKSIIYGRDEDDTKEGVCLHDDGTPMHYRIIGKREFGEVCLPQKWVVTGKSEGRYTEELVFIDGLSFGEKGDGDWKPLPAPASRELLK